MSLKPGAYKLTADVTNPHGDGRYKNDWTYRRVIFAGATFVVDVWGRISMVGERYGDVTQDGDFGASIAAKLEPCEESVGTILRKYGANHWHAYALPEMLVKQGTITLEALDKALETHHNNPSEE